MRVMSMTKVRLNALGPSRSGPRPLIGRRWIVSSKTGPRGPVRGLDGLDLFLDRIAKFGIVAAKTRVSSSNGIKSVLNERRVDFGIISTKVL